MDGRRLLTELPACKTKTPLGNRTSLLDTFEREKVAGCMINPMTKFQHLRPAGCGRLRLVAWLPHSGLWQG